MWPRYVPAPHHSVFVLRRCLRPLCATILCSRGTYCRRGTDEQCTSGSPQKGTELFQYPSLMYGAHTQYVHMIEMASMLCMVDMGFLTVQNETEGLHNGVDSLEFLWSTFEDPESVEEQKSFEETSSGWARGVSLCGAPRDQYTDVAHTAHSLLR